MRSNVFFAPMFAVGLVLICSETCRSQTAFQNLDFESATVVPIPSDFYGRIQFAPAFPGWSGYVGTRPLSLNLYNHLFVNLNSACIALLGPTYSGGTIAGNYSAVLEVGNDPGPGYTYPGTSTTPVDVSIAQTGLVPAGSQSIQLISSGERNGFILSLGGQPIDLFITGTQNGYNIYRGDISPFAGLTEELRITALSALLSPDDLYLDSIAFSAQPVPEPGVSGLLALGVGICFALRTRRNSARA